MNVTSGKSVQNETTTALTANRASDKVVCLKMRPEIPKRTCMASLAIALAVWGAIGVGRALGGPPGEKIEFSEAPTKDPVVVSNLNRLDPNPRGFKQVQEDLLRPFGSLDPRGTLDLQDLMNGPIAPPQRPIQGPLSKRTLEALDRKRNWAFTTYEDLFMSQDDAEKKMFGIKEYGADGQDKRTMSAIDRYYESLDGKNLTATNQTPQEARARFINENGFDPLGKSVKSGDRFMKSMFGFEEPDSVADKADGTGFGAQGADKNESAPGSPDDALMQLKKIEDMREKIWSDIAARQAKPANPLGTADEFNVQKPPSAESLFEQQYSETHEKPANPFLIVDPMAGLLHSHVNDDLTARALGLPNNTKTQTNSVTPPSAQSVQSQWDPFGANRPKPRF